LDSFWNYVWQKRSYAQDSSGYYVPSKVREIQSYTFFAEDYTFLKYDILTSTIPDGLSDSALKTYLQEYVNDAVQVATQIYMAEPEVLTHTVTNEGKTYKIKTVSNSTISDFKFSASTNLKITFNVTGDPNTAGFCYVTMPTELSYGSFNIKIGEKQYTVTEPTHNGHESILNLTYTNPSQITITTYVEASAYYRDYTTFIESFKDLAKAYPSLVSYEVVGKTVLNKDILMFRIGNPYGGKILIDGAMHAAENLGSEMLYFYAKWLLTSGDPLANRILARNCMLLIPALNVDKYGNARKNANGVDLNRNFATNWQYGGSSDPTSEYYRGPSPLSEPESKTIVNMFQAEKPRFYINLHRGGSILYGSTYCNSTYYSTLHTKIKQLASQRGVPSYGFQAISGAGFAMSDAAKAGITSFLLELIDWQEITLQQIENEIMPKFIPVIAVLSQECEGEVIFQDGFESGNFGSWSGFTVTSGATAEVSNLKSYTGSYSAKFETAAITSGTRRAYVYEQFVESSVVYARGYFYIAQGLPLADADDRFTLIQFLSSSGGILSNLQIRRVAGEDRFTLYAFDTMQTTTAIYPQQNTWYCVELFTRIHSTEGAVKAYINGVEYLSLVNINTTEFGNIATVRFGLANSVNIQKTVTVYCDSAAISTSYIGLSFPPWDVNQDGMVTMLDIGIVANVFGTTPKSPNWNPKADVNSDGKVDMVDINIVCLHFGEQYT
ncbi:MAG: M14 family zinc carboxypeptidase, partial [Candidatus Bathyarchaeia archaeon]